MRMEDSDKPLYVGLINTLMRIDPWLQRLDSNSVRITPALGSPLGEDDRRVDPYQTSFAVLHSISHAVDHLHMLRTGLREGGSIHMYAPYSLVRGGLENASAAVWMLFPSKRVERLARRLRFAAMDINNGEKMKALLGAVGPRSLDDRLDVVRKLALQAGIPEKVALKSASYREIVRVAGIDSGIGEQVAQVVWGLSSGIAHGDFWTTLAGASTVEMPGAPDGIAHLKVEASLKTLWTATLTAINMTSEAWRLYDLRATAPR
jgi:hypothetical protein